MELDRSPRTGWTRAHWEACADRLIAGAIAHSSPTGARVCFPGTVPNDPTDELEGFARSFLLRAIRLAGSRDADELTRLATALDAGSRPGHAEAWPVLAEHDQATVEAAAVAVGLHCAGPQLWDALASTTREQLVDWFSAGRGLWCADNNHVLLGATIEAFLASVGADHDGMIVDAALNRMQEWYVGDGWYNDGVGRRFDHYNGWTFHLYPFWIEQLLGGQAATAAGRTPAFDVFRTRLRLFLDDYQHLFDATGSPVLQGRSLIYRWGMAAPFWMGELQGVSPLTPGRTRRLASGMLAGFVDHGAVEDDVLGLGWKGPAPDLLQSYNAGGSPLWASKGFLGLLLPPEHPAWQDVEEPLALEESDVVRPLGGPRWLAVGRREDGIARLLNHGSDGHPQNANRLYRRLAYSSATVPTEIAGLADNTVSVGPRGAASRHRGLRAGVVRSEGAASRWFVDAGRRDVVVDVATLVLGDAELRLTRVQGVLDQPVRCTGWPLPGAEPLADWTPPGWAGMADSTGLVSAIAPVTTSGEIGEVSVGVESGPHQTALGEHIALPWLELHAGSTGGVQVAWLVLLGRGVDESLPSRLSVTWLPDGALVELDGRRRHCAWVRETPWAGDAVNQGIFKAGAAPLAG